MLQKIAWFIRYSYLFVVFRAHELEQTTDSKTASSDPFTSMNFVLFRNYVISVHAKPIAGLETVVKRIQDEYVFDTDDEGLPIIPIQRRKSMFLAPQTACSSATAPPSPLVPETLSTNPVAPPTHALGEESFIELIDHVVSASSNGNSAHHVNESPSEEKMLDSSMAAAKDTEQVPKVIVQTQNKKAMMFVVHFRLTLLVLHLIGYSMHG